MKEQIVFQNSEEMKELQKLISKIKEKYSINLFSNINKEESNLIPITIFSETLSPLSALTNHLQNKGFSIKNIALKLNRSNKTIYQAITQIKKTAKKQKKQEKNIKQDNQIFIPLKLFANRKLSIMEILISYLHKDNNMRFSEIARILNKDPRTIWTTWNRFKKKNVSIN